MTTKKRLDNFDNLKSIYHDSKLVRYTTIVVGGVIIVYLTAKAFKGAATLLRSYNDMKLAYNGQ
jgi:hypothetical protein